MATLRAHLAHVAPGRRRTGPSYQSSVPAQRAAPFSADGGFSPKFSVLVMKRVAFGEPNSKYVNSDGPAVNGKAGENCKWIIVSNFDEIRLYNKNIGEERYESFFISQLGDEYKLKRFFYILGSTRLFLEKQKSIVESELEKRQQHLQSITKTFYSHYKQLRLELFEHLRKENLQL